VIFRRCWRDMVTMAANNRFVRTALRAAEQAMR
jgi:hypothetical protein